MEILPGIHTVPGVSWSRVYLIADEALALIDSGLPWSARRVLDYITSIGRRHEELQLILTTHSHPDHTTGARSISRRTGSVVAAHRLDTRTVSGGQTALSFMGAFNSLPLPFPFLARIPVGRLVTDGEALPLLGGLRVVHTPGHTPGSVCYLAETRGVLFSGDTAFSDGKRVSRSVPFPGYNGLHYRKSLQRLAGLGVRHTLRWTRLAPGGRGLGQAEGPAGQESGPAHLGRLPEEHTGAVVPETEPDRRGFLDARRTYLGYAYVTRRVPGRSGTPPRPPSESRR